MKRAYLVLPLVGLALLGCRDQESPTEPPAPPGPSFALNTEQGAARDDARVLVGQLFPFGTLRTSARLQLEAIASDMAVEPPRVERAKLRALAFIVFTAALHHKGRLLDPSGPPTTLEGVLKLICDISIIAPLPRIREAICPLHPGTISGGDGFIVTVNSSADQIDDFVVSPSQNLVVKIPWGQGDVVLIGSRLQDDIPVQDLYLEASKPKWRVVLLPARDPLPAGTPDDRRFQISTCVDEDLESDVRTPLWKPYLRFLQVHADRSVTVPDPAPPLVERTEACVLADHPPLPDIGAASGPFSRLVSRGVHALRRLASIAASLLTPKPLFAGRNVGLIDVGGVGGFLDGFSDFPLGYVFPDLFIGDGEGGRPALGSSTVVQGGTVSVSSWTVTNVEAQSGRPRPDRPAGGAPGDVALVDHVGDVDVTLPAVRHGYYLSADNTLGEGDVLLTSTSTSRSLLTAGNSASVLGATLTIPTMWPAGPAHVLAVVDDQNQVPEIRPTAGNDANDGETNNIVALSVTVTGGDWDLTIDSLTQEPAQQSQVTVGVVVRNLGASVDAAFHVQLRLDRTSPSPMQGPSGLFLVTGLASEANTTVLQFQATLEPGEWRLTATADFNGVIPETNETNNVAVRDFTHGAAVGGISVIVMDAGTTAPIEGATVSLNASASKQTDNTGRVHFNNLSAGTYVVGVASAGYVAATQSVTVGADQTTVQFAMQVPTATALASGVPLAGVGFTVPLEATVTPAPPLGSIVEFFEGATSLGTALTNEAGTATRSVTLNGVLARQFFTARFTGTTSHGASTSPVAVQEKWQHFDDLASFTAALGAAVPETQDFEGLDLGTTVRAVIGSVLNVTSSFPTLGVFECTTKCLFGAGGDVRLLGNGQYDLVLLPPRNAIAFDLASQDPATGPASIQIFAALTGITIGERNLGADESTPNFFGIILTVPIQRVLVLEGPEVGGSGNEEIGLDNFIIASVPFSP